MTSVKETHIVNSEKPENPKTEQQRKALHVWLGQLAEILNDAGIDQVVFFEKYVRGGFNVPWTKHSIKEVMYKPILTSMSGKLSTEEMNTVEPSEICKVLGHTLSERCGITPPPWPSRFGEKQ